MTTMRTNNLKAILKAAVRVLAILPFAACVALGQQTINLTAGPAKAYLPDGSAVPMWGYSCGTAVTGATALFNATHVAVAPVTAVPQLDRKSTRLNSSHITLSYAVFC